MFMLLLEVLVSLLDSFDAFQKLGFIYTDQLLVVVVFFLELKFQFVFQLEDDLVPFLLGLRVAGSVLLDLECHVFLLIFLGTRKVL